VAFPIALISPGGDVSHYWYTALAEELASHGWVVASMAHAHSSLDVFPGKGLVGSTDWGLDVEDPAAEGAADDRLSDVLAADASYVLDRLTALESGLPGDYLAGRVDAGRAAILGHSRGGSTVGRACSTEARFRACVILDNIGPLRERETGLPRPHLTLRASGWNDSRIARLRSFLALNAVESWDVEIEGAHHFTFSDLPLLGMPGPAGAIDPRRGHAIASVIVRAFLERHVLGSPVSIEEVASEFPEARALRIVPARAP
jgi:predicted dienelactone hydrolase